MKKDKSYRQLNKELEEIIYQLDSELDDIDKAVELYGKGEKILKQIDEYLKRAKIKIDKAQTRKQE
jgi:exodeoxyribonuclease VII small subunit